MPQIISPELRLILGFMLSIIVLLAIAGAVSIPFYFESSSILYKSGTDRLFLRSGQVIGMVVGCLLLLQIILGARLKCLDRIFGLSDLFRFHRIAGFIIGGLIIIHPIMIFIPENRVFIPLELRYWPEFVGFLLLLLIIFTVISSHWRSWMRFSFHRWWRIHQWTTVLIITGFWVHVLSVSETFDQALPKVFAYGSMALCGLVFFWIRIRPLRNRRRSFKVSVMEPAGEDAIRIEIVPNTRNELGYMPGQFSFFTFFSNHISNEEHPFSFTSSPKRPSCVEMVIRTTGDWTRKLNGIQPGDRILLNGPFGLFSNLQLPQKKEIIMIAGGIGITPLYSMCQTMAERGDVRPVLLLYGAQDWESLTFREELDELTERMSLQVIYVLTDPPEGWEGERGYIDGEILQRYLPEQYKHFVYFICGPQPLMDAMEEALPGLGVPPENVLSERFGMV
jgi:predicted ferric reductase